MNMVYAPRYGLSSRRVRHTHHRALRLKAVASRVHPAAALRGYGNDLGANGAAGLGRVAEESCFIGGASVGNHTRVALTLWRNPLLLRAP